MKILLLLAFVYQFYYSSLGGDYSLKTEVEIYNSTIEISNEKGCIEYTILESLPEEETNTGKIKRFNVVHRGQHLYIEINKQYCFVRGNEEEVYSNFQVKRIEN